MFNIMTLGVSLDTESQLNMYQERCIEQVYATCLVLCWICVKTQNKHSIKSVYHSKVTSKFCKTTFFCHKQQLKLETRVEKNVPVATFLFIFIRNRRMWLWQCFITWIVVHISAVRKSNIWWVTHTTYTTPYSIPIRQC